MKGLLIKTNGVAMPVDWFEGDVSGKLHWYYKRIGCDCIDIVETHGLNEVAEKYGLEAVAGKFCLVCDDEALCKENPKVNPIASLLYGVDSHGQPLFGDVLVGKNSLTDDGLDTVGLDESELDLLYACIDSLIAQHNEKVKGAKHDRD